MLISFFYVILIASACLMLFSTNPINAVLFLILTFLDASIIFFLIGCDFLGLVFIIIYLGAIAVLFLFIVMMVNIKKIEGDTTTYLVIGVLFFIIFFFQISYYVISFYEFEFFHNLKMNTNSYYFDNVNKLDFFTKSNYFFTLGRLLYLDYFFFMVSISFLLLIGMVGAIFLTNYKNNFFSKKQFNQLSRNSKLLNLHII